eukprot:1047004-Pyramimonas_sp.AAC.1
MMYAAGQVPVCRIARNFAVFLACALYGVHPLRVEPYTLAGVFLAGALNCHVTSRLALTHAHAKRQKEDWCGVRAFFWAQDAVVLFACACLSKAAALPAVVLLPLMDVMLFPELLKAHDPHQKAAAVDGTVDGTVD